MVLGVGIPDGPGELARQETHVREAAFVTVIYIFLCLNNEVLTTV